MNHLHEEITFFTFIILRRLLYKLKNVLEYDLYVRDTIVNFSGKEKRAISVNGQIPMPTLEFTGRRYGCNSST